MKEKQHESSWSGWYPGKFMMKPLKIMIKPIVYVAKVPFKVVGHFTGKKGSDSTNNYHFHLNNLLMKKFFHHKDEEQHESHTKDLEEFDN